MTGLASRAERRAGWLLSAPALIAIALFFILPTVASLALSLTDFDIYALADIGNLRFVGLANYSALLSDPLFWTALGNTFWFVLLGVPLVVVVAFFAAILVNERMVAWRPAWRAVFFAPYVTTLVAAAVVWKYMLHARYGLFNHALGAIGLPPVDWLGDPRWAIPAITVFVVWKSFGYSMLIFLAALQTVPRELDEAARIDGAGWWSRLRHVTLPAVAPAAGLVAVLAVIAMFQLFAEPYVMTEGGPAQSTITVLYLMFDQGFQWWNLGIGAAVAVVLFACILAAALIPALALRIYRRRRA
ncbi:carbohydrate ABC transporter permease [Pelagerythrobacter marensis]|uniref:Binding-protein-dependent transport systems inner membrane component n=1 Tax=Pelagerythrobacter marensis TaxID=543877 RepID=A0A0G3X6S1_9SPHN|nr:sugar ABC transporter permease [Pelagerythrobacter marensis]AKM06309.1 Binding-protein-dependent transport systems inner membrane component [Pelagerythrobacter marensis]